MAPAPHFLPRESISRTLEKEEPPMSSKTPLALMKEKFGEKSKLVEALEKLSGEELWVARTSASKGLAHVSNAKLLRLLEKVPPAQRAARFRCVLALQRLLYSAATRKWMVPPGQQIIFFEGVCEGRISLRPSGRGGFGYDPLFVPDGFSQSFAELGEEAKNTLSHRAAALKKLSQYLAK